jgi:transposase, IS30 family
VDLVARGSTLTAAAIEVGVSHGQGWVWWQQGGRMELEFSPGPKGGLAAPMPPACPGRGPVRRALSSEDRAVIAVGIAEGWTQAKISRVTGRDKSVISRELARNRAANGTYNAAVAHRVAAKRRERPKAPKLVENHVLRERVSAGMDIGWSPHLISQMLAREASCPDAAHTDTVSHETIYRSLYVQARGGLRADLCAKLSTKRTARKTREGAAQRGPSPFKHAYTISDRPAEVEDRAVPGHWEGDLILGTRGKSAIGTLVERSTRFTMLLHLPGRHDADSVAEAMIREMSQLPEHLRRSITWDRGTELAQYEKIQLALETRLFFCDPHSPWQRGTNENTNRLLRFWFEKGTDLSVHTPEDLARVAALLNQRPRPTLDLDTPANRLNQLLNQAA